MDDVATIACAYALTGLLIAALTMGTLLRARSTARQLMRAKLLELE